MAIDPNILLQNVAPDLGQALLRGVSMGATIREQQRAEQLQAERMKASELERQAAQQKLDQANREAEILRVGITAQKLMPYIKSKDIAGFKQNLANSGLPTADIEEFSALADNNAWDSIQSVADQGIQIARDTGVFGREYGAGASGYVSAGAQAIREAERLSELRKSGAITEKEYNDRIEILNKSTVVDVGGIKSVLKPGETIATPVTLPGGPTTAPEIATTQAAQSAEAKALEQQAKDFPAKEAGLKSQIKSLQDRASQIDVLMKTPGREDATGFERNLPGVFQRAGSDAQTYIAEYNKFKSGEFLTGVQQLRNLGSLSNAEGLKLESLLASLTLETNDETHYKTLQAIKDQTAKLIKTAEDELRAERLKMSELKAAARGAVPPPPTPEQPKNVDLNAPIEPAAAPQKWFYDRTTKTYKKIGG